MLLYMLSSWGMYEMHLALFLKVGCDSKKACACYRQTFPAGSGIGRGSSSTLGGTRPSLGR
jgi:hypothetical protein